MSSYLYNHHNTCWLLFCHNEQNILFIRKCGVYFAYRISLDHYSVHFFKLTLPHFISCALKKLCYSLWFYIGYLKCVQINMRVSRTYSEALKEPLNFSQLQDQINNPWWHLPPYFCKCFLMMLSDVNYVASSIEIWSWIDIGQIDSTG